jgi:chemotaxis protein histidine kinase CheA
MDTEDLLPLFLSEAFERLDRLDVILGGDPPLKDSPGWRSARRELHTLKGAGRMMGLMEVAEACHQAEGAFELQEAAGSDELMARVRHVRKLIEGLQKGESTVSESSPDSDQVAPSDKAPFLEPRMDIRVPTDVLDRVTDRALRISFFSRGVGAMVEDLFSMARIAETGAGRGNPEQVLAALALRLRRTALRAQQSRGRFDRLIDQQLTTLLPIQVQPVRPLLSGLGRHAVELGHSLGKEVDVQVEATRCRLDRRIMDALKEALLHLVRNAVDHGIETQSERVSAGKKPVGKIVLRAEATAQRVRLIVQDDGRGVRSQEVLSKAVEQGLLTSESAEAMPDDAVWQLLFHPGFSTRLEASTVSGRGIGLDSVADAVRSVGGEVWIDGSTGEGMTVTLDLPMTRSGESILVVEAGGFLVGIPEHQVVAFSGINTDSAFGSGEDRIGDASSLRINLSNWFGRVKTRVSVVIHARSSGVPLELVVDRVVGEEEVILRPWPGFLGRIEGTDGLALLEDGTPIGVLDLQHFVQPNGVRPESFAQNSSGLVAPRVLLVDDSRITREMFRRILTDGGVEVESVASGEEALVVLESHEIDCLVTDIEMPGLDGLELTRWVRQDSRWEHLPVVVVSTRDRPVDRRAGLEAGADVYLAKQNMEDSELVATVRRLWGGG